MPRIFVIILAVLALVVGAIWIGQGTGVFPYPASSFMIRRTPWAFYGGGLVLVGIVLIGLARRR